MAGDAESGFGSFAGGWVGRGDEERRQVLDQLTFVIEEQRGPPFPVAFAVTKNRVKLPANWEGQHSHK